MRIMDDAEYKIELLRKVVEEAHEMVGAAESKEELMKELSDLEEALDCVRLAFGLDKEEALRVKEERKQTRGSFMKKIYMESAE
jgi:predicted house-cleaning noncanonical NTP pyrophosphatase (MazG superfamily)